MPATTPSRRATRAWAIGAGATLLVVMVIMTACSDSEPESLPGSNWRLTTLDDAAPVEGSTITLGFDDQGMATGSGGCNRYFGGVTIDGDQITFGTLGATRVACEPPILDQEFAYLAALESAAMYRLDGPSLTLHDAQGATLATFEAIEEAAQAG